MAAPGFKLTPEFEASVSSSNLLRTRIMLKDSMVIDPTGKQFDGMLDYAKRKLPGIVVSYDGEPLEADPSKWDRELMNRELILLVNNFSNERIGHLWQVIQQVRKDDIRRLQCYEKRQPPKVARTPSNVSPRSGSSSPARVSAVNKTSPDKRKQNQGCALASLRVAGEKIKKVLKETEDRGKVWNPEQVTSMKQAAQDILDAVAKYEENR